MFCSYCQVPFQLRMTTAFLVALGRNPNDKFMVVKSGEGHYEFKPDEPEPQVHLSAAFVQTVLQGS